VNEPTDNAMIQCENLTKRTWKSPGLGAVLIILLTFVTYIPALRGGFVFDDSMFITDYQLVKASDGLFRIWFTTAPPDYYPLTWTMWWLEWRLWGDNPTGYHVVNVLLHAANAILVWMILQRLKIPGAWLAALVFAIHPVNVATVAWISEQKNTLSMFFYALAILLYLRFDEEGRWNWYGLALAAFLLALLGKTAVAMLPVILLGCVWWKRGRVQWKDVVRSVPFFVLSLFLGLVTIWFQFEHILKGHPVRTNGFFSHVIMAGEVPWFYLSKAFWPVGLTLVYPKWNMDSLRWISYLPGIVLLGCLALFWQKRNTWGRPPLFALGYFLVMLLPVAGLLDQGFYAYTLVADHWQYYAIVGVIALAVAAGEKCARRIDKQNGSVGELAGVVLLVLLGLASWNRARVYADDESLWRDNLAKNPQSWLAHTNLGGDLEQAGETEKARGHYEQALQINPDYAPAHYNLGRILWQAGHVQEAVRHWELALRNNPDLAEVHYSLGVALRQEGNSREATIHWEEAVRLDPDYIEARIDLGSALFEQGQIQEAIAQYEQALRINSDYAEVRYNLGLALQQAGRIPEAIAQYRQALRIKPDYPEVREKLAQLQVTP
jgi:tetratricopeptide (TPR) repeat protein